MIFLWLKIIGYKIIKAARRNRADTGTETGVSRTRHEAEISTEIHAAADRRNTARMRELIDKGLVHEPDGLGDLQRTMLFDEDRAERMRRAFFERAACPCGGRCYPSADAYERDQQRIVPGSREASFPSESLMAVRPPKEIVCCRACGHPDHSTQGGVCAFLVPARGNDGEQLPCRCTGGAESGSADGEDS